MDGVNSETTPGPSADATLLLRWLDSGDDGLVHVTVCADREEKHIRFSLDGREPDPEIVGAFKNEWEAGFVLPLAQAAMLARFLDYALKEIAIHE